MFLNIKNPERFKYLYNMLFPCMKTKTKGTPIWVQRRYAMLWQRFKDGKKITFEKISKELKKDKRIKDDRMVSVILSDLRKAGWLKVELNPENTRKRFYQLVNPKDVYETMEIKTNEN